MTHAEYDALPPFYRAFPKSTLEQQYAKNAKSLRWMKARAERASGHIYGGYTPAQLEERATEFERLSHAS